MQLALHCGSWRNRVVIAVRPAEDTRRLVVVRFICPICSVVQRLWACGGHCQWRRHYAVTVTADLAAEQMLNPRQCSRCRIGRALPLYSRTCGASSDTAVLWLTVWWGSCCWVVRL